MILLLICINKSKNEIPFSSNNGYFSVNSPKGIEWNRHGLLWLVGLRDREVFWHLAYHSKAYAGIFPDTDVVG